VKKTVVIGGNIDGIPVFLIDGHEASPVLQSGCTHPDIANASPGLFRLLRSDDGVVP
jgi:hypothetical protein